MFRFCLHIESTFSEGERPDDRVCVCVCGVVTVRSVQIEKKHEKWRQCQCDRVENSQVTTIQQQQWELKVDKINSKCRQHSGKLSITLCETELTVPQEVQVYNVNGKKQHTHTPNFPSAILFTSGNCTNIITVKQEHRSSCFPDKEVQIFLWGRVEWDNETLDQNTSGRWMFPDTKPHLRKHPNTHTDPAHHLFVLFPGGTGKTVQTLSDLM